MQHLVLGQFYALHGNYYVALPDLETPQWPQLFLQQIDEDTLLPDPYAYYGYIVCRDHKSLQAFDPRATGVTPYTPTDLTLDDLRPLPDAMTARHRPIHS